MGASVVHFEVISKDPDQLRKFFGELFEWNFSEPMGPTDYRMIDRNTNNDGVGIAGGIGGVPEGYDGHVTFYVEVEDIGKTLEKVEELGGKKMMGPDQVPEGPVIGLFSDPQGHVIGLVAPAGSSESSESESSESSSGSGERESASSESSESSHDDHESSSDSSESTSDTQTSEHE